MVSYKDFGKIPFMPFCYGYATTIRRAQGSTLRLVGLWFDHKYPADRGYAYVGSSRVRAAHDLFLVGRVKRSDWLPVGEEKPEEQTHRGVDSEDTSSNSDAGSEDQGATSSDSDVGSEDQGAASSDSEEDDDDDCDPEGGNVFQNLHRQEQAGARRADESTPGDESESSGDGLFGKLHRQERASIRSAAEGITSGEDEPDGACDLFGGDSELEADHEQGRHTLFP